MAEFARSLQGVAGKTARLQHGVELIQARVGGCDHAGVVTVPSRRGEPVTAAATDDLVRQGDTWQFDLNEGPCLDANDADQTTVLSQDLTSDGRWPQWTTKVVADLGVYAMLSLRLYTDAGTIGSLNLYADHTHPWQPDHLAVADDLAAHFAVAVADAAQIDNRGQAMTSRTLIGQAQGILMDRLGLDSDTAFGYLRRISQDTNQKLATVAEDLIATRHLP